MAISFSWIRALFGYSMITDLAEDLITANTFMINLNLILELYLLLGSTWLSQKINHFKVRLKFLCPKYKYFIQPHMDCAFNFFLV